MVGNQGLLFLKVLKTSNRRFAAKSLGVAGVGSALPGILWDPKLSQHVGIFGSIRDGTI